MLRDRNTRHFMMFARLAPGVTMEQLVRKCKRLQIAWPVPRRLEPRNWRHCVRLASRTSGAPGDASDSDYHPAGGSGVVLLIVSLTGKPAADTR